MDIVVCDPKPIKQTICEHSVLQQMNQEQTKIYTCLPDSLSLQNSTKNNGHSAKYFLLWGSVSAGRVSGTRWNKASKQKTHVLQTRSVLHQ